MVILTGPIQFPAISPIGFVKPKAPKMQPVHALPPPPPNLGELQCV